MVLTDPVSELTVADFLSPFAPSGPSTPFGEGVWVLDLLRCVVFGCCAVMLGCSVAAMLQAHTVGQVVRFGSTSLMVLVIAGTEAAHLGDDAHWRLALSLLGTGLGAWGLFAFLRYETPGAGQRQADRDAARSARRRTRERTELLEH